MFWLAISIKDIFLESVEGFVESEEKFVLHEFITFSQRPAAVRTAVSHAEMEVWSTCDFFAQN